MGPQRNGCDGSALVDMIPDEHRPWLSGGMVDNFVAIGPDAAAAKLRSVGQDPAGDYPSKTPPTS